MATPEPHARPTRWRAARRLIVLALLLLGLLLLGRFLPVVDWLHELRRQGETLGWTWPLLFAALYVLSALLLVPGAVPTLLAGAFFGIVQGTLIVSLSATVVALLAFAFARSFAGRQVEALARRSPRLDLIRVAIQRSGWRAVLLLRLSPVVPFSISNYLYGLSGVRFLPYLWATWIGTLPGALLYVWLGHLGLMSPGEAAEHSAVEWMLLGVGLAATGLVTWLLIQQAKTALRAASISVDDDPR